MTEPHHKFSDEELTAFLDGEAEGSVARAIEADLEQDEALLERLTYLDIPKADIAAQFDALLSAAPPMPELPPVVAPPAANKDSAPRFKGLGLGLGAGLVAGFAMAMTFGLTRAPIVQELPPRGWIAAVASYQTLYMPATLTGAAQPDADEVLANLSAAVGLDLTGFQNVEGLEFHRAQQLGFNGKPLIQIAYKLPDGTPFAICILPSGNDAKAPRFQQVEGMQSVDWNTGQHGILMIGGDDAGAVQSLVPKVEALL